MLSNVRKTGVAILVMVSKVTVKGVGEGNIRNCFGNVGEGDIRNCFGKLNDSGKPALRRPGILPQQLSTSPFVSTTKNAARMPQINERNRLPWSALRCHRDRLSTIILAPFLAVVLFALR